MNWKYCYVTFLVLMFMVIIVPNGLAAAKLYLSPPSPANYDNLNIGEAFTLQIIAEADSPGVTMFSITVSWSPSSAVEFIHPMSGGSLMMTGFFPSSSGDSRLSGIMPNSTSQFSSGSAGSTPAMAIFTAPALNSTGPDSLMSITFRKQSSTYPVFGASGSGYNSAGSSVPVNSQTPYVSVDADDAEVTGAMLSQATGVIVNIDGTDYQASVAGGTWTLDISNVAPATSARQITVNAMQGGSLLSSFTTSDLIRSPGWYVSATNHSGTPADSDGDGDTDSTDLLILAQAYGSSAGGDLYDYRCDYNGDGVVNLGDFLIFGLNYNR